MPKKRKNPAAAAASKAARDAAKAARAAKKASKAQANQPLRSTKDKTERRRNKEELRAAKMKQRRDEKKAITADMWAAPVPSHLVATLDKPKIKTKYQSYYEFADNPNKKEKKLEFKTHSDVNPPPGYTFVPVGDPVMTATCKELSREQDAMVFIVSTQNHQTSKISEHVHRIGFHFRETIVEQAREIVGDTVISKPNKHGFIEPIPESQEEINKQADGAIRDLFPKIPNTDRTMIIEHAFKKGGEFHGEPTVGLQSNIPLSRRVQLAVLAHIRHTHTRYDQLLRETSWLNARKAVEPVCLDIIMKWRGDDETGRDQMDEILREVVIITDSESGDESSDDDSSDEDGEVTSLSSTESLSQPNSRNQNRLVKTNGTARPENGAATSIDQRPTSSYNGPSTNTRSQKDKRAQKGFKRYQAAWDDAVNRRQEPARNTVPNPPFQTPVYQPSQSNFLPIMGGPTPRSVNNTPANHYSSIGYYGKEEPRKYAGLMDSHGVQYASYPGPSTHVIEVSARPYPERPVYYDDMPPPSGSYSSATTEQRPPQVVRGSGAKHNLQDMLVESVETPSSDVFPPSLDGRNRFNHSQDSYPRRAVDYQQQHLPVQPEVIVIEDDSPLPKRRRFVQDDVSGHFRPVQSRDNASYVAAPYPDSHLASTSSVQSQDFFAQRPPISSQAPQRFARDIPDMYTDSVTGEQLPIYDAPPSGRISAYPEYSRRPDSGYPTGLQEVDYNTRRSGFSQPSYANEASSSMRTKPYYEDDIEIVEHSQARPVDRSYTNRYHNSRPFSPAYALPNKQPRSYDMGPYSVGSDPKLESNFSQSRVDGPVPYGRDGYTVISERPPQPFSSQESRIPFESHSFDSSSQRLLPQASATYYELPRQSTHRYGNDAGPLPPSQHGAWQPWNQAPGPRTEVRDVIFIE